MKSVTETLEELMLEHDAIQEKFEDCVTDKLNDLLEKQDEIHNKIISEFEASSNKVSDKDISITFLKDRHTSDLDVYIESSEGSSRLSLKEFINFVKIVKEVY